jgi:hypothetical protein
MRWEEGSGFGEGVSLLAVRAEAELVAGKASFSISFGRRADRGFFALLLVLPLDSR